jgi:hypothetical protein
MAALVSSAQKRRCCDANDLRTCTRLDAQGCAVNISLRLLGAWGWSCSTKKVINVVCCPGVGSARVRRKSRGPARSARVQIRTNHAKTAVPYHSSGLSKGLAEENGGESGIRTRGSLLRPEDSSRSPVLQTSALDRSAISPLKAVSGEDVSKRLTPHLQCKNSCLQLAACTNIHLPPFLSTSLWWDIPIKAKWITRPGCFAPNENPRFVADSFSSSREAVPDFSFRVSSRTSDSGALVGCTGPGCVGSASSRASNSVDGGYIASSACRSFVSKASSTARESSLLCSDARLFNTDCSLS